VSDIFGDFFGFGPNPPGCMAKNTQPVDVKKEKERFINLLTAEAKRYDIQGMHIDLNKKMDQIVHNIKKEEKVIMNDEERQLRNLDKLEYMSQYLNEDHVLTQKSLQDAQKIKDNSKKEMEDYEKDGIYELQELERQVLQMETLIQEQEKKQAEIQQDNYKLQKTIQSNRDTDQTKNSKQVDSIVAKDKEFE
jgi:hypothetical protein